MQVRQTTEPCGSWEEIAEGFRAAYARWGDMDDGAPERARNRVFSGPCVLDVRPKFLLDPGRPVYTIGSCFARNIELALEKAGVEVASRYRNTRGYVKEVRASDGALFNRFNVPSIFYEARAISDPDWLGERLVYDIRPRQAYDAYFSPAQDYRPREEKLAIRREILAYQHAFVRRCGAVMLTLGLSEAVYDADAGMYLNGAPVLGRWNQSHGAALRGHVVGLQETVDYLVQAREALRAAAGPGLKIIVTVSPVPLLATFSGRDVVVANAASKARLRVAADEFAAAFDDVDYFPSYEMALHSDPGFAFNRDRRHVMPQMVQHIMASFMRHYYPAVADAPADAAQQPLQRQGA